MNKFRCDRADRATELPPAASMPRTASLPEDLTLLAAKDVCTLLGVSESWLWAQLQKGAFPQPVRLGRRCTRWRMKDIRSFLEQRVSGA